MYLCNGSSHLLLNKNVVTISQNLLPFVKKEVDRYFSFFYQIKNFKIRTKNIFLNFLRELFFYTSTQKKIISQIPSINKKKNTIIGHSINLNTKISKFKNFDKYS